MIRSLIQYRRQGRERPPRPELASRSQTIRHQVPLIWERVRLLPTTTPCWVRHSIPTSKSASNTKSNNGAVTFRGTSFDQGRKLASLSDGASKTPLAAETKEKRLASWYDGTCNWLVAARHGNNTGQLVNPPANNTTTGTVNGLSVNGKWVVGSNGQTTSGAGHSINVGPSPTTPQAIYMPKNSCTDPVLYHATIVCGVPAATMPAASYRTSTAMLTWKALPTGSIRTCTCGSSPATAANRSRPRNRRLQPSAALAVGG